ncbi:hypothetical protein TI05_09825, partial [Achromatium sp. WMS3]
MNKLHPNINHIKLNMHLNYLGYLLVYLVWFVCLSIPGVLLACPQLTDSRLAQLNWSQRLALTEQAFACNPSFTAAYQHGLSQFHLNQLDAAMATYRDFAHPLAQSPRQKGLISLGMAQIFTVR